MGEHERAVYKAWAWCVGAIGCCIVIGIASYNIYTNRLLYSGDYIEVPIMTQCYNGKIWKKRGMDGTGN